MAAKKPAFSLNSLDTVAACNKPFEVQINDVHGNPTPFFVSVLGRDSDAYRNLVDSRADEELKQRATGKKDKVAALKDIRELNTDGLVAVTVGWRVGDDPLVELDGESLDCTPANARKVYERLLPVRDQVQGAINNLENFMPA